LASLLDLCGDDWSWLDTLRSVAGEKRCISFAWAEGRRQISGSRQICEGLSVLGEGDWVLTPPSREPHGTQHAYLNPEAEALGAHACNRALDFLGWRPSHGRPRLSDGHSVVLADRTMGLLRDRTQGSLIILRRLQNSCNRRGSIR
jgi:hypothetical protein